MPTKLRGVPFEVSRRLLPQRLANAYRAGKGDLRDRRVRDQRRGNLCRVSAHEAQYARWQARLDERPDELHASRRRLLGWLDDDTASRAQCPTQLARRKICGEIPR